MTAFLTGRRTLRRLVIALIIQKLAFLPFGNEIFAADSASASAADQTQIDFLIAGNAHNQSLISSGAGHATLRYERFIGDGAQGSKVLSSLGKSSLELRDVEWSFDHADRRVDVKSLPLPPGVARFCLPLNERCAWNETSRIYYHEFEKGLWEAYINEPRPATFRFVRNCLTIFDPMLFFKADDYSLADWIKLLRDRHETIKLQAKDGESRIIADAQGDSKPVHVEIVVSEDLGFNITSFKLYSKPPDQEPSPWIDLRVEYVGSGKDGRKGPFFPSAYKLRHYFSQEVVCWEEVEVKFQNIKLNEPIDPGTFTFAKMDVALGTRLLDFRKDPPIITYYGGYSTAELDATVRNLQNEEQVTRDPSSSQPSKDLSLASADKNTSRNYFLVFFFLTSLITLVCALYIGTKLHRRTR